MKNYFKASSWDPLLKLITTAVTVFVIVFIFFNPKLITILVLGALVIIPSFFMIRGYSFDNQKLIIHRLGWAKEIDLKTFKSAQINNKAMNNSWRLLGNGGLFGWLGTFSNKEQGIFRAYVTNRYRCVILELDEKKIVVSPDSPNDFIARARDLFQ